MVMGVDHVAFVAILLKHFRVHDFSPDLVSGAADALLPLILCEQSLYQVSSLEALSMMLDRFLQVEVSSLIKKLSLFCVLK